MGKPVDGVDETQRWGHVQGVSACQKSHHSGKSRANSRQRHMRVPEKFAPESQNRRKEKNIDHVIKYTYTLRGTSE